MRKDLGAKPQLYPQPVFIIGTYNEDGTPNAMNAAWGGITEETEVTICISDDHKTADNLVKRNAFTLSMGTEATVKACDYVGIVSGNDVPNKMEKPDGMSCQAIRWMLRYLRSCRWLWSVKLSVMTKSAAV